MPVNAQLLSTSSRESEESRIVANWLERLEDILGPEQESLFRAALHQAKITRAELDRADHLSQRHLDDALGKLRASVPDITLWLFSRAEILDLGLVGYAAINSDTVGRAIQVMYQYHSLASDRYADNLEIEGDKAIIFPTPLPGYADDFQNIVEDSFSGNWRALQVLLGPLSDKSRIKVCCEHPSPPYLETYLEIFGPNCHFEQELTSLQFPAEWLELPVHHGGGALAEVYTAMCERVLGPGEARHDTAQVVRRLLLSRTGRTMPRLEDAVRQLRLTPGQLRKRLYKVGTSYKQLVLEIRMELARHYLMDTHLSVQEIAYLLDYATSAPFSRAFKLYYGMAPEHYRQNLPSDAPGSKGL